MQNLSKRLLRLSERTVAPPPPVNDDPVDPGMFGLKDAMLSGWFLNDTDEVFRGVPISAEDVVVDIGCGEGGNLSFCANRGAHVIGVDLDADALEVARKRIAETPARRADFHLATAESVPLADGAATRVLCTEVLEHVDDPAVVLTELVRIGAPGALYLLAVPDSLQEGLQATVAPPSYFEKPNHIRTIERDEFPRMVTDAGLEVLSQQGYGFFWAIWWAMFWGCQADLDKPDHPALTHWTQAWSAFLDTESGRSAKEQLDQFLPKSQVIVARRPG